MNFEKMGFTKEDFASALARINAAMPSAKDLMKGLGMKLPDEGKAPLNDEEWAKLHTWAEQVDQRNVREEIESAIGLIFSAVEDACHEATMKRLADQTFLEDEAINWGDLGCARVSLTTDDGHNFNYVAIVEEAEPSSTELMRFVKNHLTEHGYDNVIVLTEWRFKLLPCD